MAALGPGKGNFGANCGEHRAARPVGLRNRRRIVAPDGRESQGMERESINGAFDVGGLPRDIDIYLFDTRPADADRFLAPNKYWRYAAREAETGPGRLQNGPGPAVAEPGAARPWERSGKTNGGDGPCRRAPEKNGRSGGI